jgi:thiol-disulfide isomerase/thioredoxin
MTRRLVKPRDLATRDPRARSGERRSGLPRWPWRTAGLLVVTTCVGLGGVTTRGVPQSLAATDPVAETRPVQVTGDPLPRLEGYPDPAAGRPLPELRGASFDGQAVAITRDGSPKLLVFLAHWCPHCQREAPLLVAWLKQGGGPKGVAVYGVASGTRPDYPNYPPSAWLRREGWPRPVLADDDRGTAGAAVGLSGYPFFVLVDAAGRVVQRRTGEIAIPDLERLLTRVRGG